MSTLAQARQDAGLSLAQLAHAVALELGQEKPYSRTHLSDVERGRRNPSPALDAAWLKVCGTLSGKGRLG